MFIGLSILPSIGGEYKEEKKNFFIDEIINSSFNPDEFDQEQPWCWQGGGIIYGCHYYAQAFKPTLNRLTRVELALEGDQNETTTLSDLTISIRKDLTGEDLTSVTIPIENIGPFLHLMSVDFPDIFVIPENTYYIVARTIGGGWDGSYWWSYCQQETYNRGYAWSSTDCGLTWSLLNFGGNDIDWAAFIFRTYGYNTEKNNPPTMPSNPYPENGSINIPINVILNWSGGDPDDGDTITYDVFFGGMLPIQKIASNISNTSINPGNLVKGLTYFWNVVAWDNHNASTIGPSWHFTTINPDNRPPNKPNKPSGLIKGKIGQNYTFTTSTTDPEGEQLYYNWSWGDGTFSGWIGPYHNGEIVNESNSWTDKGNYNIKVKAKDILGLESDWSDPLAIRIPKIYIYNPVLQLKILGGLLTPRLKNVIGGFIVNVCNDTVYNVSCTLNVTGGFDNGIDAKTSAYIEEILPGNAWGVSIYGIYGFGPVIVTFTVKSNNTDDMVETANGFQFRYFTWIPFSWLSLFSLN